MIIMYIENTCKEAGGINIDDNYNISLFLTEVLSLENKFVSNWEFMVSGINVIIGVDVFTLDYSLHSYFQEIVECLDKNSLNNGLDVSNVGGFD